MNLRKSLLRTHMLARAALGLGRAADVIIIGAQKCGTSSLYRYLRQHPGVSAAVRPEVHYFDIRHHRGPRWYAAHFSGQPGLVTVESSPYYMLHPLAPGRIAKDLPSARFIVMMRNPVDRAYSQYNGEVAKGHETLSFAEALRREPERIASSPKFHRDFSYRTRGVYADQLEAWFALFPREAFHIIISEEMFADERAAFDGVCDFIGAPRHAAIDFTPFNTRSYPKMPPEIRAELSDFYRPHNQRLAERLGRDLPWS